MKIIYCSNPNGSLSQIYTLLKETIADIYIISGNLLDTPFYSRDLSLEYESLRNALLAGRSSAESQSLTDVAQSITQDRSLPDNARKDAESYLSLTDKAIGVMKKKYSMLDKVLSTKPYAKIILVPGHNDMNLEGTDIEDRSIHGKTTLIDSIQFAGFGKAPFCSPAFPETACGFNDINTYENEVRAFLSATTPDIIISHLPPSGVFVNSPHSSSSLKSYCDTHDVLLCLSGLPCSDWGIRSDNSTIFAHAPSFGDTGKSGNYVCEGGFFFEIEINKNGISRCLMQKLVRDRVYDIASYSITGSIITEIIIDDKRHDSLIQGRPLDTLTERYEHIPELKRFKDIRNFFKIYQTEHTEKKISHLISALEKMSDGFSDVALDLVGSANLGLAQKSSDLDMVLYIRSAEKACYDEDVICGRFSQAEKRIREILGETVEFEIIDTINLNLVEESIRNNDYDSSSLQRFIVYRSMCRPVNYRIIAPAEDLLNGNITLRREIEETMSEYLQVFGTTKDTTKSFDKYRTRIRTLGVDIPEVLEKKIRNFLQKD